jgi:hypothetical protein
LIEFLAPLIANDKKKINLSEDMQQLYFQVLDIVIRRIKYPEWVTFDDIFEFEEEYYFYRNDLAMIF